jgi:hypothetical protein
MHMPGMLTGSSSRGSTRQKAQFDVDSHPHDSTPNGALVVSDLQTPLAHAIKNSATDVQTWHPVSPFGRWIPDITDYRSLL